jgi:DNA-binding IclR family transcriptional regulator
MSITKYDLVYAHVVKAGKAGITVPELMKKTKYSRNLVYTYIKDMAHDNYIKRTKKTRLTENNRAAKVYVAA